MRAGSRSIVVLLTVLGVLGIAENSAWSAPAYVYDDDLGVSIDVGATTAVTSAEQPFRDGLAAGPAVRYRYDDSANLARASARVDGYRSAPNTTRAAVGAADDVPLHSPNFVVHPNGEIVPVPTGAIGPTPARTGSGFQFRGGSGGHGLDPRVTDVRIMDPVVGGKHPLPNGYVSYGNASGQTVSPWTGRTIDPGNPWWHWQWSP